MELIKTVNLHKRFGDLKVLTGVNQTIHKGEVVSIIGPSGGGKSTFLRCLNLLEKPEEGQIFFGGADITAKNVDIDKHRQKMGMVFQQFNVFPHLSVAENIKLAPKLLKGMSDEALRTAFCRYQRRPAPNDCSNGIGLGLSLVRSVAAIHGGTVLLQRLEPRGTRATMTLAVRHCSSTVLKSPLLVPDYAGEHDHALLEFSEILPPEFYLQ